MSPSAGAKKAERFPVQPIPVHAVTGAPRSGKSARIAQYAGQEPDSLGLVNVRMLNLPNLVMAPLGCPCCTARMALQVALSRLLREHRPARVYVELPRPEHASALSAVLRQWPLSQYVVPGDGYCGADYSDVSASSEVGPGS